MKRTYLKSGAFGSAKGSFEVGLAIRLLKKQRLRTAAVFCGMLVSGFLLGAFGSFGYEFWGQVHQGATEGAVFDATSRILAALVAILLLLVVSCSGLLLYNLFSLTFHQQWQSLWRLGMLGARRRSLAAVTGLETFFLYCPAFLTGQLLILALQRGLGLRFRPPAWISQGSWLLVLLMSLLCSLGPLRAALRQRGDRGRRGRQQPRRSPLGVRGFAHAMSNRYHSANRRHYRRITLTVLAAILLYVPVSYLINTNLSVQQEELTARFGIWYSCSPENFAEVEGALEEYRRLREGGNSVSSVVTVSLPGAASIPAELISGELRQALREAGWREETALLAEGRICFLEEEAYAEYLEGCRNQGEGKDLDLLGKGDSRPALLVNRYINRTGWREGGQLPAQAVAALKAGADPADVEIYDTFDREFQPVPGRTFTADVITDKIPEGVDFTGDLLLILPLSRLEEFFSERETYENIQVQGGFEERDEGTYPALERVLGAKSLGKLRDARKIAEEWYDSMSGIHMAMKAICILLFSVSVLNIFSMMIFQYLERKKGLAVLWSLGQSPQSLLKILIAENMRSFWVAMAFGIPLSWGICYYIYRVFCRVWSVAFGLPAGQTLWIGAVALGVSAAGVLLDYFLMKRQDFLSEIKRIL